MNKVLEWQLKKIFGSLENVPTTLNELLTVISTTYDHSEEDRLMIERSLDISSKELGELNKRIRTESDTIKNKLDEIERTNKLMIDRELKMISLKEEIKVLEDQKREKACGLAKGGRFR